MKFLKILLRCVFWLLILALMAAPVYLITLVSRDEIARYEPPAPPKLVETAVGASAWSIVRQFLYESLLVMMANVAISIALVVNVGVLYKIFMEWQSGFLDTYVLYLTPHSMVIFGACAVTLTVVFSLIFAYKSTQVEIVQYLKAE